MLPPLDITTLAATEFDPMTAKIGGVLVISIHMTLMSQLRRFFLTDRLRAIFDVMNYPLAFLECLILVPPYPLTPERIGAWIAASIGLSVACSTTAEKVIRAAERHRPVKAKKPDATQATNEYPTIK